MIEFRDFVAAWENSETKGKKKNDNSIAPKQFLSGVWPF